MSRRSMSPAGARRVAWGLFGLAAAFAVVGTVFVPLNDQSLVENSILAVIFLAMGGIGSLIASRRPENAIGWLLIGITTTIGFAFATNGYAVYGLVTEPGSLPGAVWFGVFGAPGWTLAVGSLVTFVFLLFPDGHLPSRRWRPVGWAVAGLIVLASVLILFDPALELPGGTSNPLAVEAAGEAIGLVIGIVFVLLGPLSILSVASLFVRFRRADEEERHQIKWLALAGVLVATTFAVQIVGEWTRTQVLIDSLPMTILYTLGYLSIPAAVGVALLRYRLYEIDVVIRKTVVVAVVAMFITLVYVGIVVGIGALVAGASDGPLPIVAAVVIAVAFQPVRSAANRLANRIVLGERATPYQVLSAFSERLAGAYATDDLLPRMARILGEGTGATRAEIWLRVGDRLRRSATWPPDSDEGPDFVPLAGGDLPPLDGSRALPVRHEGELLGAIAVTKPPSEPLSHEEEQLLEHLTLQAGLVLRNVRLTEELRARLDELQASRQRIVAAQDEERRRLERNLHDGAQQELVALAVKQRLVETMVRRDPERAAALLAELQSDTSSALETLRDLARGIYPPLLADKGLAAALQAQAGKASVPTTVDVDGVGRYTQEAEAAVYFCSLEAMQNVAKYAGASRTTITLREEAGSLRFRVEDDGIGFDPAATPKGAGTQNMADRLAALGGTLEITSAPGAGTIVVGRVPVHRPAHVER